MGRRHRHLNRIQCGAVMDYDARFIQGLSNGAQPTGWDNRSGSLNLTRTGTAADLTYNTNAQGGQPCMRFNGTAALLRYSSYNPTTVGYSNQATVIAGCLSTKATSTQRLLYRWRQSATNVMQIWAQFSDNLMYFDHGRESAPGRISAAASTTTAATLISAMAGPSTGNIKRNGVQIASGTMSASVASIATNFDLGGFTGAEHWVGDFFAFIHAPLASEPVRRRIEQSVAFSFKLAI